MIFKWETEEQRLKKFIKISPQKKLEWLQQMHEFMLRTSSKQKIKNRKKLRER